MLNMISCRILVLGDSAVGKTALITTFCQDDFIRVYDPTDAPGKLYQTRRIIDKIPCIVEIFESSGQDVHYAFRDERIRESDAIVLVYSITNRSTFHSIYRFRERISQIRPNNLPIILVGNKCDRSFERQVPLEELIITAKELQVDWIESSVWTMVNVERVFFILVRIVHSQEKRRAKRARTSKCEIL